MTESDAALTYGTSAIRRTRHTRQQMDLLDQAIYDIARAEQPISVRGAFYRVLTHPLNLEHHLVDKTESGYGKVQRHLLALRRRADIPYSWIVDGTRWVIAGAAYDDTEHALTDLAASYRRNLWRTQPCRVEVWSEKDAMAGIVSPITEKWQVGLHVQRGFSSDTFLWASAQAALAAAKPTIVLNIGDHDASGVRAWLDVCNKLPAFAPSVTWHFERLAVTPEQIAELGLPTRPQKRTSHAADWDGGAVECDAIPSPIIRQLINEAITQWIDPHVYDSEMMVEAAERDFLRSMVVAHD